MNKFCKIGFIEYNGSLRVQSSLLRVSSSTTRCALATTRGMSPVTGEHDQKAAIIGDELSAASSDA